MSNGWADLGRMVTDAGREMQERVDTLERESIAAHRKIDALEKHDLAYRLKELERRADLAEADRFADRQRIQRLEERVDTSLEEKVCPEPYRWKIRESKCFMSLEEWYGSFRVVDRGKVVFQSKIYAEADAFYRGLLWGAGVQE